MNNREKRFFNVAKELSELGDYEKAHLGAVVVYGNRIISTGFNSNKTNPLQDKYNRFRHFRVDKQTLPKTHAEIAALNPIKNQDLDWNHISIYLYRSMKDGSRSCARPCPACQALIRDLGIKTIYYTDWDGNYVKEKII